MKKYPTSIEEDIELLKDESLTFNKKNCIMYRKSEKDILRYLMDCCDRVNELSKMTAKEAR